MYNCDICDKEFASNKKLLFHLERCEKRTNGSVYEYRSDERSTQSRGYKSTSRPSTRPKLTKSLYNRKSKSDSEQLNRGACDPRTSFSEAKYVRSIEKLRNERRSLKDKLMEADSIHMEDMRKNADYYDDKIQSLRNENERTSVRLEETEHERETEAEKNNLSMIKLRKQYAKKLASIKLENDNVNQVMELEQSVRTLKDDHAQLKRHLESVERDREITVNELTYRIEQNVERSQKTKEHNQLVLENIEKACDDTIKQNDTIYQQQIDSLRSQLSTEVDNGKALNKTIQEANKTITDLKQIVREDVDKKQVMSDQSKEQCISHVREKQKYSNLSKTHALTVDELERMKKSFGKTLNEQKQRILVLEQSARK
jgi:hypothetical protein